MAGIDPKFVNENTETDCQEHVLVTSLAGSPSVNAEPGFSPAAVLGSSIQSTGDEDTSGQNCEVSGCNTNEGVGPGLPAESTMVLEAEQCNEEEKPDPQVEPPQEEEGVPLNEEARLPNEEAWSPNNAEVEQPMEVELPVNDSVCQVITKLSQLDDEYLYLEGVEPLDISTEEQQETGNQGSQSDRDGKNSSDPSGTFEQTPNVFECKLVDICAQEECECPICNLIARKPAKVSCCGRVFCHACIVTQTECPLCRDTFEHCMVDKLLERKIRHQQVYCVNQDKGCEWTGELGDVPLHLQDPTNQPQQPGTQRCLHQLTTCKKCDQELMHVELNHHMDSVCKHRMVRCEYQFAGCHFKGPEMNMPQHIQENTATHLALISKLLKDEKREFKKFHWFCLFALVALAVGLFVLFSYQQARISDLEEKSSKLLLQLVQANAKEQNVSAINLTSEVAKYFNNAVDYFANFLPLNFTHTEV